MLGRCSPCARQQLAAEIQAIQLGAYRRRRYLGQDESSSGFGWKLALGVAVVGAMFAYGAYTLRSDFA